MIKSVLFDLDGVLIDSEGIYTEFWSRMDSLYPTGVKDFAHVIKGNTLTKILTTYFPDPEVQSQLRDHLANQEANMPYRLFSGAIDLMKGLKGLGISTAIVTSSNRAKMSHLFHVLPELAGLCDVLIADEDVNRSKPDPQGYLLAADKLGAKKGEFVVVEDSIAGLQAGSSAGAKVIGLATTNPRTAIEPLADYVADDISCVSPVLISSL